jgi:hypothetical protein
MEKMADHVLSKTFRMLHIFFHATFLFHLHGEDCSFPLAGPLHFTSLHFKRKDGTVFCLYFNYEHSGVVITISVHSNYCDRLYVSKNYNQTPLSRVLLDKLVVARLFKKLLAFYRTRRFITVFTRAHHWFIS